MPASDFDKLLVEFDASGFDLAPRAGPKFVIAGNPNELLEFPRQCMETPIELMQPIDNVASKNQPVFPERREGVERLPIDGMRQVKIRECK